METQKMTAEEIIESLEYTAKFIPWSQSRSAKENPKLSDYNLNWIVSIKRGRAEVSTDYFQGWSLIKAIPIIYGKKVCLDDSERIKKICEKGVFIHQDSILPGKPLPAPDIKDVLHCLLMDSDVLNYSSFEEWADNFGYNPDSRKDEKIYQVCLKIALQVKQLFTSTEIETLEEFFQDY